MLVVLNREPILRASPHSFFHRSPTFSVPKENRTKLSECTPVSHARGGSDAAQERHVVCASAFSFCVSSCVTPHRLNCAFSCLPVPALVLRRRHTGQRGTHTRTPAHTVRACVPATVFWRSPSCRFFFCSPVLLPYLVSRFQVFCPSSALLALLFFFSLLAHSLFVFVRVSVRVRVPALRRGCGLSIIVYIPTVLLAAPHAHLVPLPSLRCSVPLGRLCSLCFLSALKKRNERPSGEAPAFPSDTGDGAAAGPLGTVTLSCFPAVSRRRSPLSCRPPARRSLFSSFLVVRSLSGPAARVVLATDMR